ncbi:MAG: hypothetical protein M3552_17960 [Planctomycetota bacterium]|nr:hypothetical protein [Planctomycetaceae bacterium]MDQ3332506.1 hypothetical protein [Planctomycetota bacterium]
MTDDFDDDDFEETEVHIMIEPREDAIAKLGVDLDAFEEALSKAIDKRFEMIDGLGDEDEIPPIEETPITIGDRTFALKELADIVITDDEDDFDESE